MAKRLILARHGETELNRQGCFVGRTDLPLSDLGQQQADALARVVAKNPPDEIFVSPLIRARQTAEKLQPTAQVDDDLREIDFGCWDGLTFDEISAREDAHLLEGWACFDSEFCFPEGESLKAFLARTDEAAYRMMEHPADTVMVVAHGGVIRAMLCYLLELDPKNYCVFEVKPASLTTIEITSSCGVLTGLNDRCHLGSC